MLLTVGRVLRPHGIRGEVVVEVHTDEPEQRYAAGSVLFAEPAEPRRPGSRAAADPVPATLTVAGARPHQGKLIVAFRGVSDRTAAEALRGTWLRVDSDQVPPPADPDEF